MKNITNKIRDAEDRIFRKADKISGLVKWKLFSYALDNFNSLGFCQNIVSIYTDELRL